MKKLTRNIFVAYLILLSSCGIYQSNLRNSPMLTKAGEIQGSVLLKRGFEGQGAVALTNHIGVISSYSHYERSQSSGKFEKRTFFEGGVGYFKNSETSFFELFAGYGQGSADILNRSSMSDGQRYSESGRFNKFFIQPGIGYRRKKWSTSFVPRLSLINLFEHENTKGNGSPGKFFLFEPGGATRYHISDKLFLSIQGGFSVAFVKFGQPGLWTQAGGGIGFRFNAEKK